MLSMNSTFLPKRAAKIRTFLLSANFFQKKSRKFALDKGYSTKAQTSKKTYHADTQSLRPKDAFKGNFRGIIPWQIVPPDHGRKATS